MLDVGAEDRCPLLMHDVQIVVLLDDKKTIIASVYFNINMETTSPIVFRRSDLDGEKRFRNFQLIPASEDFALHLHVELSEVGNSEGPRRPRRLSESALPLGPHSPSVLHRPLKDPEIAPALPLTPLTAHLSIQSYQLAVPTPDLARRSSGLQSSVDSSPSLPSPVLPPVPSPSLSTIAFAMLPPKVQRKPTGWITTNKSRGLSRYSDDDDMPPTTSTATPPTSQVLDQSLGSPADLEQRRLQQFGFVETLQTGHQSLNHAPVEQPAPDNLMQTIAAAKLEQDTKQSHVTQEAARQEQTHSQSRSIPTTPWEEANDVQKEDV